MDFAFKLNKRQASNTVKLIIRLKNIYAMAHRQKSIPCPPRRLAEVAVRPTGQRPVLNQRAGRRAPFWDPVRSGLAEAAAIPHHGGGGPQGAVPTATHPRTVMIYSLDDKHPQLAPTSWVAPGAMLIGDIRLDDEASVWWGAVLRAEAERIHVGAGSNVQDNAVLHVDPGFPLTVGAGVTVGHQAMLHGCTIGDGTLIGIGATVLNGARIGRECMIGAHALIAEGKEIPDRSVVMGIPGKIVRTVSDAELEQLRRGAESYRARSRQYAAGLKPVPGR